MEEHNAPDDVNVFLTENDPKPVEKLVMKASNAGSVPGSSDDTIHEETNEDVANIQDETVITAKTLENEETVKLSNIENEAVLTNTLHEEGTSGGESDRASLAKRQSAAIKVKEMSKETLRIVTTGRKILGIVNSTAQTLQSYVRAFETKARKIPEHATNRNILADFYRTIISTYQAHIVDLDNRSRYVEEALDRVKKSTPKCQEHATLIEQITDETLDESRRIIHTTESYTDEGKDAIIDAIREERSALVKTREIWLDVRRDVLHEERARLGLPWNSDDIPPQPEPDHRDTLVIIVHIVFFFFGFALVYVATLFPIGSESFISILLLALIFIVWCAVYLSYRLWEYRKSRKSKIIQEKTAAETLEVRDVYLEKCDDHIHHLEMDLVNYGESLNTETSSSLYIETNAGSSETVRQRTI